MREGEGWGKGRVMHGPGAGAHACGWLGGLTPSDGWIGRCVLNSYWGRGEGNGVGGISRWCGVGAVGYACTNAALIVLHTTYPYSGARN